MSRYAVMTAFYRLQPQIKLIQTVQSGGDNEAWIEASFNFSKQMKIMLGEITLREDIMQDRHGEH